MIRFEYNGGLKVSIDGQIGKFLENSEFPIRFVVYDNSNRVHHSVDMYANTFASCFDASYKTVEIISAKGVKMATWKWDAMIHGDACQQAFNLWSKRNEGLQGICIGAHNGTSGEWVGPVSDGILNAILVEPSDTQLNQLRLRYERLPWVNIENSLITTNGGEVVFYESTFQNGQINSVSSDVISKCTSDYIEKRYESVSLRDLISKYNISDRWWLHIDAEGIDDELIYSIDEKNLPSCLIFEYSHFDEYRIEQIKRWLDQNSYKYITSNMNMMCVRD